MGDRGLSTLSLFGKKPRGFCRELLSVVWHDAPTVISDHQLGFPHHEAGIIHEPLSLTSWAANSRLSLQYGFYLACSSPK